MSKTYTHRWLSSVFDLEELHNELKKALTHKSLYEKDESKTGSRYIYLGMYAFKGKVCELTEKYMPVGCTQLQHYLGNLFKEEDLHKIFHKYHLEDLSRSGVGYDVLRYKHLFVYGFL